ncbi:MAG: penicillin-binding protein 2, partial [Ectothiorhodospiraceae bacterium]
MAASERTASEMLPRWRLGVVLAAFALLAGALLWRAVDLQVLRNDFLRNQGDARYLREVADPAHRGTITDRNGEPLAISTPVASVWAHPGKLLEQRDRLDELAALLDRDAPGLVDDLEERSEREFVYLERQVRPATATAVQALDLPGVALEREFQRFYPAGEVTAHVLGFTDVDDVGLAALELAYDSWLQGEPGRQRVLQDRHGRVVDTVERMQEPRPGRDLRLTIDRRLQYLAYRQIKAAVSRHDARGGAIVLMDPDTGAVLA